MRLGLRSRRHAYDLGDLDTDPFKPEKTEALPDRAPDGVRRRSYDKAFEPAVAQGLLTVQNAWARGSRDAYSIGLQRRYELTEDLAYKVADNRIPLIEALETLDREADGTLSELTGMRLRLFPQLVPLVAVMLIAVLPVFKYGQGLWEHETQTGRSVELLSFARAARRASPVSQPTVVPERPARARVERDMNGRITRITAGNPGVVLEEVCRLASSSDLCGWMEVRDTEPRHAGLRLGRFATQDGLGEIWSVRIRRNRSSGRWGVGTGLRPLEPIAEGRGGPRGTDSEDSPFSLALAVSQQP